MATQNTKATVPAYVDYKDTRYLAQFLTPHARMHSGRKSAVPAGHQRKIEVAIKRARFMALLPYISR
ncbi:MAG: 30S ribosomal protein S18 [Patescibacteria group bacterium]|nr:30S ribosomal protein S18 [Patescibacteria group bacterium]